MLKFQHLTANLTAILLILTTGCSHSNHSQDLVAAKNKAALKQASSPTNSYSPSPEQLSLNVAPRDFFQAGLDAAEGADTISKSAVSKDDWGLVSSQLSKAIAEMESVPRSSKNYAVAEKKITEYQSKLAYAQKQIASWSEARTDTNSPVVIIESCSEKKIIASLIAFLEKHPDNINDPIPKYAPDAWGSPWSALHTTAGFGCKGYVELLISMGADVNNVGLAGLTPLHMVWRKDIAALLIAKGANVNAMDEQGSTALHYKAQSDYEVVKTRKNADVKDILATAKLLITSGAQVNARDNEGRTALYLAKQRNFQEMVKLLKSKGGIE